MYSGLKSRHFQNCWITGTSVPCLYVHKVAQLLSLDVIIQHAPEQQQGVSDGVSCGVCRVRRDQHIVQLVERTLLGKRLFVEHIKGRSLDALLLQSCRTLGWRGEIRESEKPLIRAGSSTVLPLPMFTNTALGFMAAMASASIKSTVFSVIGKAATT